MKLIVKLPKDKLPFVGIQFPYSYDAGKTNQDLVINFKHVSYKLVFEFVKNTVNVKLVSDENMIMRSYNGLEFDREKLKTWFYLTKDAKAFNFSHTVKESGKEMVVRTLQKPLLFILKLNKCEIINNEV
ncbi:MAG: hypothetical protein ABIP51_05745 [Bacteroidia bacterium]